MECQYCCKQCKNTNSLVQHEIRCTNNPSKIHVKSNFIKYNEKVKNGEIQKQNSNQFTKAKRLGLQSPVVSDATRNKISATMKQLQIWTEARRKKHSSIMIKTAIKYPDSYSANNICGRTKLVKVEDSFGNIVNVNGGWEKCVADYLNTNNVKWTNIISEKIYYYWNNKTRIYYPDFYLPDYNRYIEVKGYQRDRDLAKWEVLKGRLVILKAKEINYIKNNKFNIDMLLSSHV